MNLFIFNMGIPPPYVKSEINPRSGQDLGEEILLSKVTQLTLSPGLVIRNFPCGD